MLLFWTGPGGDQLDDEMFQSAVFGKVVVPLLDGLADSEGKSCIR